MHSTNTGYIKYGSLMYENTVYNCENLETV